MSGTVNISRGLFDSEAFRDEVLTEREAWVWMVMAASWKDRSVRSGDYVVNTLRGQLAHSVRYMAKAWKWTPAKVQRYLKRIEKLEMIRVETDTGVSVITVCKYDEYQNGGKAADTGPIQDRYRTDTEKKKGERREEGNSSFGDVTPAPEQREAKASPKNGTRLPKDWFLSKHLGEWAVSEGASVDLVRQEAEKFRDYWHSVAGAKGSKLDWDAVWRNWIRKALEDQKPPFKAIQGGQDGKRFDEPDRIQRVVGAAAAGTSRQDWG